MKANILTLSSYKESYTMKLSTFVRRVTTLHIDHLKLTEAQFSTKYPAMTVPPRFLCLCCRGMKNILADKHPKLNEHYRLLEEECTDYIESRLNGCKTVDSYVVFIREYNITAEEYRKDLLADLLQYALQLESESESQSK